MPLTGTGGVTWDTSDLFNPAASFDGTTGYMTTSRQAINTTGSYTISAWVKPEALGGIILSQYGSQASCIRLSITSTDPATAAWRFAVTDSSSASATSTSATAGSTYPVTLGAWTHLTAIYDAADKRITLYVNGTRADSAGTSGVWSSGCDTFALSRWNGGGTLGGYFDGKIADVQAWNGVYLSPIQIASLSGTPGYVLFPADSHQYPTGSRWVTAHGQLSFNQGQLAVKETGTGSSTATFGATGHPGAVLTLQADGNLVSYPTAADATAQTNAIWASGTAGNPGDVMFFQPDGNLVIYNGYGAVLWSSNTAN
ncbi:MAG: hypothetical protein JO345_13285 [Streptosporangiaceae bacterium]|nr:hypothetical protein [Streptosporangiaceae bacterium]